MATNSSTKKSLIPRSTHDCDRPDLAKSKLRGPKPKPPAPKQPTRSKPGLNDGLMKEDDDSVRRSLLELEGDHARMKQTLEATVHEAEERLAEMEKLMAERDRLCSANLTAAAERTETLEQQVESYEIALIENDIDPVTGTAVDPTTEQSAAVEKKKKVSKKDVSKMREKLQEMNDNSDKYLIDVQNILQEIEELEITSQKVGSNAAELDKLSDKDLKALIQEVEEAQKKEEQQQKKKEEEEDSQEEEEEEEEEELESPSPKQEEKENSQPSNKPDVFLTQDN